MFPISMLSIRILDPFTIQCLLIQSVNLSHIASQSFIVDFFYLVDALGVTSKKKPSIFVDIVQIEVDLPPSYLIFDKFIFDILLIMLTSLPPLEFLTKIMKF